MDTQLPEKAGSQFTVRALPKYRVVPQRAHSEHLLPTVDCELFTVDFFLQYSAEADEG
jgi:hypothetical protein